MVAREDGPDGPDDRPPDGAVVDGTWHVTRTSLPFWRTRTDPTITYAPLPGGAVLDVVRYRRRGRERVVLGLDRPDGTGGWVWRGRDPLTLLTTSRWRVVDHGPGWVVTWFARTAFTPQGVDVCTRSPEPDRDVVGAAVSALAAHPVTRRFVPDLFAPEVSERV